MPELNSNVENTDNSQSLCELELWKPPQGTIAEAIPLSIDLDFDSEIVNFSSTSFSVRARRATIQLRVADADIVRGSRLGEYALDTQMTAEVTQSVRHAIETEVGAEGHIEVDVKPNILGRLMAAVSWKKRRSKRAEHDHIIKSSLRVSRIIPRNKGKWAVVEPVKPHILSGRFIGSDGDKEVGPLCLLTMHGADCLCQITVTVNRQDLDIEAAAGGLPASRNKVVIIEAMARRGISSNQVANFALPPNIGNDDIVLARSVMEVSLEDE
ncbi:hypothetical protein [Roseovarius indicus]|uniref:Uncharacterized protein n=1 Tax=Roseovarius indicus TaxID=540747 RepID=A0A5P3AFJ8_9RHOB|nr:hypothetical protein [Roseovarius indicus]QEW27078.1 hypothetical protein RIdsm_02887 [Roseovarius indicus]SFD54554.1 hypothetical protein SAMN04488031_101458 [Roseovarius indicus]